MRRFLEFAFKDVRTWILLFFVIRLVGITNAPLEVSHNWRQTSVNTVARNFQEIDNNIFYPRFDTAGNASGISGTEFPFLNYLIYISNLLFGYSHWYGRLINLILSSFGTLAFYRLAREWISERVAFNATLIFLVSLWFAFSRKIMPDTLSVSLCLMALWTASDYLKNGNALLLVGYVVLSSVGVLSKIPAIVALSPLAFALFLKDVPLQRKISLVAASIVPLSLAGWWYFYWFDHITTDYVLYRMGPGISKGALQLIEFPLETLNNFYFDALKFSGFASFLFGVYMIIKEKAKTLILISALYSSVFLVFMMQAGYGFRIHEYYTLPFVPLMALVAGVGLASIERSWPRNLLLAVIMIEGVANQQHDFFIKDALEYKLELESLGVEYLSNEGLVVVNGGRNPQMMYFAHRRGWSMESNELLEEGVIPRLKSEGAKYLIWDEHLSYAEPESLPILFSNDDFTFFDLRSGADGQ